MLEDRSINRTLKYAIAVPSALILLAAFAYFVSSYFEVVHTPPSPTVRPFGNDKEWIVVEDMVIRIGGTSSLIVVPKGFVSDFASIPQYLWPIGLSPHGQDSRAAVVHDFLYWAQGCTRDQADRLLILMMKESHVGTFDEWAIYAGVSGAGASAWSSNARERAAGLPKVVPEKLMRPEDPNVGWEAYRELLVKQGIRDPAFEVNPEYCKYGDSTQVPGKANGQPSTRK